MGHEVAPNESLTEVVAGMSGCENDNKNRAEDARMGHEVAPNESLTEVMHVPDEHDDAENCDNIVMEKEMLVPLPHQDGPRGAEHPRSVWAQQLRENNLCSESEFQQFMASDQSLGATRELLAAWLKNHRQGKKSAKWEERQTLLPDQTLYPGATRTSFIVDALMLMAGREQGEAVEFHRQGMQKGYSLGADEMKLKELKTVKYKNPPMTPEEEMAFALGTKKDSGLGYIARRSGAEKVWIGNPTYCIPKRALGRIRVGKFRRISNSSKRSRTQNSVNGCVEEDEATIEYVTVAQAVEESIRILLEGGKPKYDKYDMVAAFRILPMRPDQVGYAGFTDEEGHEWVELRFGFGNRIAPRLYSSLSGLIGWLLKHVFGVSCTLVYLDDYLIISVGDEQSELAAEVAEMVFELLGLEVENEKTLESEDSAIFLGLELDAIKQETRIPAAKKQSLIELVSEWEERDQVTLSELRSLCGSLTWATQVVTVAKVFLRRLYGQIAWCEKHGNKNSKFKIGKEARKDLHWWKEMLPALPCSSPWQDRALSVAVDIFSDASSFAGAGVFGKTVFQIKWTGERAWLVSPGIDIGIREMYACVTGVALHAHALSGKMVNIWCDNEGDVKATQRGKSKSAEVQHLIRVLVCLAALHRFRYTIRHIPGKDNVISDDWSRMETSEAQKLHPELEVSRVAPPLLPRADNRDWERQAIEQWRNAAAAAREAMEEE